MCIYEFVRTRNLVRPLLDWIQFINQKNLDAFEKTNPMNVLRYPGDELWCHPQLTIRTNFDLILFFFFFGMQKIIKASLNYFPLEKLTVQIIDCNINDPLLWKWSFLTNKLYPLDMFISLISPQLPW